MSRVSNGSVVLLAASLAGMVGFDGFILHRLQDLAGETARFEQSVATDLGNLRQLTAAINDDQHEDLEALVAGVAQARAEATTAARQARREALVYAERLTGRLNQAHQRRILRTDEEIASLKAVAVAANATAGRLRQQVAEASSDAAAHRTEAALAHDGAAAAVQNLEALRTGVARNIAELELLRASGEHTYTEFELPRLGQPVSLSGFRLMLKKLHPKARKCSIEVQAGGRQFVLRERDIFEPVRFYPPGTTRAHELVVTEVGENGVRGYVAAPRVSAVAAGSYSSGNAETKSLTPGR